MNPPRRIALFGGTFDPVHEGHCHVARLAHEQAQLDEVIFIPCPQSPHKVQSTRASIEHRLAMLRLAATEPWMRVSDYEARIAGPSFSYRTVEHFIAEQPNAEWFWLMGCDQWNALPRWKHPEILALHLTFLVFSRGEIPQPREGYRMMHLQGSHPASATALRDALGDHYLDPSWLQQDVRNFIIAHELYA
jgi:nicotinate-nucleotide adenylyltransferase